MKRSLAPLGVSIAILALTIPVLAFGSGLFYVDDSGNVGIGNISPQSKLDVAGALYSRLVTDSDAASTTIDWNAGNIHSLTLTTGDTTLAFSNGQSGGEYKLIIKQDSTGGRDITWPATVLWAGRLAPSLTLSASSTDLFSFVYDGTHYLGSVSSNYGTPSAEYPLTDSANLTAASNQYFTAADSGSLDVTGDLTIEVWVNFTSMPSDRAEIVSKGNSGAGDYGLSGYQIELVKNGSNYDLRANTGVSGSANFVTNASWNPSTGTWYHVAYTRSASSGQQTLYVNGVQVAQTTNASGSGENPNAGVWVGRFNSTNALNLDGHVSLVRIWNIALSGSSVASQRCVVDGSSSSLKAEWTFDSTLSDGSGNGNTLTNNNSVTFTADVPDGAISCPM